MASPADNVSNVGYSSSSSSSGGSSRHCTSKYLSHMIEYGGSNDVLFIFLSSIY